MPKLNRKLSIISIILMAMGISILLFLFISNRGAEPIILTDERDGSTVLYEIEADRVLLPTDCVTVRWNVEGIWGVYLEDAGVVGQDSRQWCIIENGNKPTLRVIFPEDVVEEYTGIITITTTRFEFLGGVMLLVIGIIMTRIPPVIWVENQVRRMQGLTTALIYIWVGGIFFIYWSVSGTPGADFILGLADRVASFVSRYLSAPYLG